MSLPTVSRTTLWRTFSPHFVRGYPAASNGTPSSSQPPKAAPSEATKNVVSSCPAATVLTGLNYLKGEPPILAKPDDEYPAWLWELTKPKEVQSRMADDDGPGGKAEKRRLRSLHRQALKDTNLFKAK